ncbi:MULTISPECIES: class I SAM-dependent methyltransferase [Methylobacterium]|uniref:Carboxy-S-adenosyl-L-methionine synthase n=1 Tax=Methylobacterium jeotgali TaxID=381630 RepID=A0ABQ4T012_9HYPH|nr:MULTISPECIES: class I SAM-dependent methyltransferase [Methylobacterium]PIU06266.1 MAG: methyltransferase [Methylobacterium sp. CG09_land_8_20_14_0_10_71_15]PIU11183.1 MAG: methyltransferase [Methylobacterium sp. CG08_land_8_20_14_0_20_71_15]GBU18969.1 methyltransferase [Methylobacterium sp.]GJE07533.1 Carboxy-S-adenosyl-L-methionine synthase [Methylobacterium jeotgali]
MADGGDGAAQGHDLGSEHFLKGFSDPEVVARYAEGPRRYVPGFESLHRMTAILLAERAPKDARVLVLGAGGGLELKALADAHPGWTFVGVDPSAEMLQAAERLLGDHMARVTLIEGYIDAAPRSSSELGPFDAATCLLTLHFLKAPERRDTLRAIRERLRPGAPFVAAHGSFPQGAERDLWLQRYAAYAVASGADPEQAETARAAVAASVQMLSPEADAAILDEAGFHDATLFFAAFTWRGWIAHA